MLCQRWDAPTLHQKQRQIQKQKKPTRKGFRVGLPNSPRRPVVHPIPIPADRATTPRGVNAEFDVLTAERSEGHE